MSEVESVPQEARENVTHEEGPTPSFEPLFEDEGNFSKEQLMGDEPQESVEDTTEKTDTATPAPEGEPEEKAKETPKEEAKEEVKEEAKPPKGYVEIQALHAERKERQNLQRELDSLRAEVHSLKVQPKPAPKADDPFADFKVLSDEEFTRLKDDEPDEAIAYLRKEQRFKEHQQKQENERVMAIRAREQEEALLSSAWKEMEEAIPNVMDRDNPETQKAIKELHDFAVRQGFDDSELAVLTSPATRVVVRDANGKERVAILANAASKLVKLIHRASKAETSLTTEKEAAIRKDEREKAFAEFTAKVKGQVKDFRSLGDLPGSSEAASVKHPKTEEEWARLTPEEERRLLGG